MKKLFLVILLSLFGMSLKAQSASAVMKVQVKVISGANVTFVSEMHKENRVNSVVVSTSPNTEVIVNSSRNELPGNKKVINSQKNRGNQLSSDLSNGTHTLLVSADNASLNGQVVASKKLLTTTIEYL